MAISLRLTGLNEKDKKGIATDKMNIKVVEPLQLGYILNDAPNGCFTKNGTSSIPNKWSAN